MENKLNNVPNMLSFDNKNLKIPWIYIDRNRIDLEIGKSKFTNVAIIGIDDLDNYWIQVKLFSSIIQAKKYIKDEILNDMNSMQSINGKTYINPTGFLQYLRCGLLPEDVRDYLSKGHTHLGFGPGINISKSKPFYALNQFGIWRPTLLP